MKAETEDLKSRVQSHWEQETCGTRYGDSTSRKDYFDEISRTRYELEPQIVDLAEFARAQNQRVLEIGVGSGSDFECWVLNGARATGVDLTESAIALTRERLQLNQIDPDTYDLRVADAENLPFDDDEFDIVYSWGVLHHTPDTQRAFREAWRVLKPGGILKAMVYHTPSWTGWMLWVQHALLRGRPFRSARRVVFDHLESPGTKAYTIREARQMLTSVGFDPLRLFSKLGPGDLLRIKPSRRYQHPIFKLLWTLYPRWFVRALGDRFGIGLLIEATKLDSSREHS